MSDKLSHGHGRAQVGALVALALLALIVVACSAGSGFASRTQATPTKTRRPTFTPLPGALTPASGLVVRGTLPPGVTVVATTSAGGAGSASGGQTVAGETSLLLFATETPTPSPTPTARPATLTPIERPGSSTVAQATPFVVVKPANLNGRRGPGTAYERIGQANQGEELFILGRSADSAWYLVCCLANQPVWVAADQVDVKNSAATAPVMTPQPTAIPVPPTPRPAPVVQQPGTGQSPLPTPGLVGTPLPPFDIARGPEFPIKRDDGRMTIWVKVHEGPADNQSPLGGYILKVTRDGVDVSDNLQSFGDRPFDKTAPVEGGYEYNLKFEKYQAGEADWEIYLARPGGFRVSPVTRFTTKGDSYRNLVVYIAYFLAR
jgi:uncharacterized protein YgiM (DUF1202 family)